ncbi:unnamed protein product [Trichogramma brassicae]|uniref:Reverse transcriptase/retrotransposon-derived protein RNase H-like domain-containing protein n=1 Tax=Trichogramma brassicae TaxID=86971 RepID=A0A6H5J436_9HYME|nr:unnamed protein product [Trichogramma brassicae]
MRSLSTPSNIATPQLHKEVTSRRIIDKRLREGIIEPSASPMNSPIWIVPKKPGPDGTPKWRIVIDFRELNKKTIGDAYPSSEHNRDYGPAGRSVTVRNVRQFLGMPGYIADSSKISLKLRKPLHDLTKRKGVKFEWKDAHEDSFQTLKKRLTTHRPDPHLPRFRQTVHANTDASDLAIAAVLSQEKDGFDHPVGYLSRVLNKAEVNYSTTEKECLAALYAMYHYPPYLLGRPFTLVADHHEPLNWMHNRHRVTKWGDVMYKRTMPTICPRNDEPRESPVKVSTLRPVAFRCPATAARIGLRELELGVTRAYSPAGEYSQKGTKLLVRSLSWSTRECSLGLPYSTASRVRRGALWRLLLQLFPGATYEFEFFRVWPVRSVLALGGGSSFSVIDLPN